MGYNLPRSTAAEMILTAIIFGLIFGVPVSVAFKAIGRCHDAVSVCVAKLPQQEPLKNVKMVITNTRHVCNADDIETATAQMGANNVLLMG